ncbi:conserved exported hypothetical protein [Candidatus Terasakiella magnetica]|uniref:Lipoprotein n=1 Tax=Candidatus Terasakiella magnetica TaxID=1867952 RepID=A0A1C3RK42_9PROT|nr:hypothetical protein [Candidatus Terasakiella magnetica]SCA57636.1 conserved exported hypothetical protein [Candidatus Terasakiella magnetica]
MPNKNKLRAYLLLGSSLLFLSACAGPPALKIISFALDGISYLATEKTVADHGLSVVTEKDCKMIRTLKKEDICKDEIVEEAMIDSEELIVPAAQ